MGGYNVLVTVLEGVTPTGVWLACKLCSRLASTMGLTAAMRRCMQRCASAAMLANLQHGHALHARLRLHPAQVRDG